MNCMEFLDYQHTEKVEKIQIIERPTSVRHCSWVLEAIGYGQLLVDLAQEIAAKFT